jgi:hypothetical protein
MPVLQDGVRFWQSLGGRGENQVLDSAVLEGVTRVEGGDSVNLDVIQCDPCQACSEVNPIVLAEQLGPGAKTSYPLLNLDRVGSRRLHEEHKPSRVRCRVLDSGCSSSWHEREW